MTEWTTVRLDALPEGTVIEWGRDSFPERAVYVSYSGWKHVLGGGSAATSQGIIRRADPGSIRVVSVPIDALLADETVQVAEDAFVNVAHLAGSIRNESESVIRAAVAHVTGGGTP